MRSWSKVQHNLPLCLHDRLISLHGISQTPQIFVMPFNLRIFQTCSREKGAEVGTGCIQLIIILHPPFFQLDSWSAHKHSTALWTQITTPGLWQPWKGVFSPLQLLTNGFRLALHQAFITYGCSESEKLMAFHTFPFFIFERVACAYNSHGCWIQKGV